MNLAPVSDVLFVWLRIQSTQATVAAGIAGLLIGGVRDPVLIGLFSATIFFLHISSNVMNDLVDVEADRVNEPRRPLVRGSLSEKEAQSLFLVLLASGLIFAFLVSLLLLLLTLIMGSRGRSRTITDHT